MTNHYVSLAAFTESTVALLHSICFKDTAKDMYGHYYHYYFDVALTTGLFAL